MRYPLQALLDATGFSMAELRRRCPMNGSVYRNAVTRGLLPDQADRWAVACGLHPFEVWPEMADHALSVCPECQGRFAPTRTNHVWCTSACYHRQYGREFQRRKYATDPEFREQKKARAVQYRQAAGRALIVKQRAWKAANADRQRAYRKAYYEANRDRILAKQRDYDRARRAEKMAGCTPSPPQAPSETVAA